MVSRRAPCEDGAADGRGARLPKAPIDEQLSFFDVAKFLAKHDPDSFPAGWHEEFRRLGLEHSADSPFPML